jgi:ornithine cyclodeaminase/alanine dehydrogenase-like protein (mu-crystallin family)
MLVLSHTDLADLLPPLQVIGAVEAALRAHSASRLIVPKRTHIDWNGNTLLTMPAIGEDALSVKLVSVVPGNADRGLPVTNGLMVLNDVETGLPQAIMNAGALTARRTGAVGALGAKYLTPPTTSSLGIIGCGVQATWQAIFACAVRPIREIFCFSRSADRRAAFAAEVQRHVPGVRVTTCCDAREALARADLIIAATTSASPVLPDERDLLEGKHFISVGSYKPDMQELPATVYRLAGTVAVDTGHACHEVGDILNLLRHDILQPTDIYSIAECVTGQRSPDTSRTTAYKTVGAAMFDLYVAHAFYRAALSCGLGSEVSL